ncbi:MAG: dTDP-4-dehydrorhamnose reductase [Chloroflexota bacterium]|nr:dTDP-4-dehydrorhamnose reductase [Chloroflexota bacterium]
MKTILITGASGQLGLALYKALFMEYVVKLDHSQLDVTDGERAGLVVATELAKVVINCAALTDTSACESDPEKAMLVNATGARNIASACSDMGATMVQISTNEVFDGETRLLYDEDDAPNPINAYGRSKLAGEEAVRGTIAEHFIVRTSWLYGPGRASFPEKIVKAAREQGSLRLVTDEVASPTWTTDLAEAIARLIETDAYGTYHVTNAGACCRKEWAEEVLRLADVDVPVEATTQSEFGAPVRKPVNSTLANNRAAALGITLRPWQEALRDHIRIWVGAGA